VHKTTLYLPPDLRAELDAAARATGQSKASLVRRAYLAERPRGLPTSIGAYRSGAFAARDDEAMLDLGSSYLSNAEAITLAVEAQHETRRGAS
jgi:Ribbon-helix-helix protein, copG family